MDGSVSDPIVIKIDARIEDARRKFAQLEKEAERSAGKIQRSFLKISAAAGQGSARGGAGSRSLAGASRRSDPGDRVRLDTSRPTGEKRDASGLSIVGNAIALGGGAVALNSPIPQVKAIGTAVGLVGTGIALTAEMIEQLDKLEIKTFTLNEAVATYEGNLKKVTDLAAEIEAGPLEDGGLGVNLAKLRNDQEVALAENQAIVTGIAVTWEGLAGSLSRVQRFGGKLADPAIAQNIIDDIKAVQDALIEISNLFEDPGTQRLLSRLQDFLARTSPSTPSFGEGGVVPDGLGQPLTDERIDPRPLKSSFLDLGFNGSRNGGRFTLASFDPADSLLGGAGRDGFDRDLADTAWRVADLSAGFVKATQAAGGYQVQGGAVAELLGRTNLLFAEQSGLLDGLRDQLPELGDAVMSLFEEGSEAGRVFAEVAEEVGASLLDAFEGAIERGESLSDVLKGLALDMARLIAERGGETRRGAAAPPPPAPANAEAPVLAMAA